jgi:hypothetical protein
MAARMASADGPAVESTMKLRRLHDGEMLGVACMTLMSMAAVVVGVVSSVVTSEMECPLDDVVAVVVAALPSCCTENDR